MIVTLLGVNRFKPHFMTMALFEDLITVIGSGNINCQVCFVHVRISCSLNIIWLLHAQNALCDAGVYLW